jgi:cyclophilin family peptidyl-prolyl cis-trans isomerase
MNLTQYAASSHDELFWGIDSSARTSDYRIETGRVAMGALSAADATDYFQITPGVGSFSLVVSADAANGWSSSSLRADFGIRITDANGTVLLNGSGTGPDIHTHSLNFISPNNNTYYVEIGNRSAGEVRYAATLLRGPTATISDDVDGIVNRATATVAFQLDFSEPVTGLDASDISVTNGTLTSVTGSGSQWTAHVTPRLDVASGVLGLTLRSGAVTSVATGLANASVSDTRQAIDTLALAPKLVTDAAFRFTADPQVTLQTSLGTVVLALDPDAAPATVANLLAYADRGYYDGTLMHRVIPGFMAQGGGFTSGMVPKTGTYDPITLESNNGLANLRGTIAMARTGVADSATSQFFINQVDNAFLNYSSPTAPGYAVFGHVLSGMAVIDSMVQVPTTTVGGAADVPVSDITIQTLSQTLAGSATSTSGRLLLSALEPGATWTYSLDAGASWQAGSGNTLALPDGQYGAGDIQVAQTDSAGNASTHIGRFTSDLQVDTQAPTVSGFSPGDGALGVALADNLVLHFSEAVLRGSGSIELRSGSPTGTLVERFDMASSGQLALAGSTLTIDPTLALSAGTRYVLTLAAGTVTDLLGNPLASSRAFDFSTNHAGQVAISGRMAAGETLTAIVTDADGTGPAQYQWFADGAPIADATTDRLVLVGSQLTQTITVSARYTDALGTAEEVTGGLGKTLELLAYSWKSHSLLEGVAVSAGARSATTGAGGAVVFDGVTDATLALQARHGLTGAAAAAAGEAVNLQDAIAILRLVVGLDINGPGQALSPYQAFAADVDGSGGVGLADAIAVLRHVVGLPAPAPQWLFFNEADAGVPATAALTPGAVPALVADLSGGSPVHAGLVGVLRGDVDGSHVAAGAADLDTVQPGYFDALTARTGLDLSQFGIYPD